MSSTQEHDLSTTQSDWTDSVEVDTTQFEQELTEAINALTNSTPPTSMAASPIITYEQNRIIFQCFLGVWFAISLVGTLGNAANIFTFFRMGVVDSVTISFMALSISDMMLLFTAFIHACKSVFAILETEYGYWFYVKPVALAFICAHIRELFSINTTLITTFIAIQRCFCVAKPLHFKRVFTRSKARFAICFAAGFSLLCYVPVLSLLRIAPMKNKKFKRIQLVMTFAKGWNTIVQFNETLAGILLPCVTQVIVLLCLIVMGRGLKKSAQFRNQAAVFEERETKEETGCDDDNIRPKGKNRNQKGQDSLSKKDTQVLIQVLLICVIFVVCNTPKIAIALTRLLVPGFDHGGIYRYLYVSMKSLRLPFELTNSAVNTFVYLRYNSKFRLTFYQIFACFMTETNSQQD